TSGWPEVSEGSTLSGYHPPDYYHVQSGEANHRTTAFFNRPFDNFTLEAAVFIDSTNTPTGDFYYGVAARRTGERYYAFLISPRAGQWRVIKNSEAGETVLAEGSSSDMHGITSADTLRLDAS